MVAPAVEQLFGDVPYRLSEVRFEKVLFLDAASLPTLKVTVTEAGVRGAATASVAIESEVATSGGSQEWTLHATMALMVGEALGVRTLDVAAAQEQLGSGTEAAAEFYATVENRFAGDFRLLRTLRQSGAVCLGEIALPADDGTGAPAPAFLRACGWLDCALQVAVARLPLEDRVGGFFSPHVGAYHCRTTARPGVSRLWAVAEEGEGGAVIVTLYDGQGWPLAQAEAVKATRIEPQLRHVVSVDRWETVAAAPALEGGVEVLRPATVAELHAAVVAR
eukprot:EG_transcript_21725